MLVGRGRDGLGDWGKGVSYMCVCVCVYVWRRGRGTDVYSRADMKASAFPAVMGTSAMRRTVTGRRLPASGMSRNWRVQFWGLAVGWEVGREG